MILDRLFTQYKKNNKLLLGSWWLNLHGRLFLGNPKDMGHGFDLVDPANLKTYYYIPINRHAPIDKSHRLKWRQDNLRLTMLREAERPRCAKAVSLALLSILPVLLLAFGGGGESGRSSSEETASANTNAEMSYETCMSHAKRWLDEDRLKSLTTEEMDIARQCMEEHQGFEQAVAEMRGY